MATCIETSTDSDSRGGGGTSPTSSPPTRPGEDGDQDEGRLTRKGQGQLQATQKSTHTDAMPSLAEIRAAIPAHCFEHNTARALSLVARDALIVFGIGALAWHTLRTEDMRAVDYFGWFMYSFWQGAAMTGWWVLAHECGHGGFSAHKTLNDCVGLVLHSVLLVPYFSWQYSHAKHHAKTNHLLDGETHNPATRRGFQKKGFETMFHVIGEDGFALFQLFFTLTFGWPVYLLTNASGARRLSKGGKIKTTLDHFRPSSQLFPEKMGSLVLVSTLGCLAWLASLYAAGVVYGHKRIALMYWPAYAWVNFWLVLYTWLQHSNEKVPHYGESEWTWLKGALCTVDRPYAECFGFFDWMHHRIGSTHAFHHIFSYAPCYHATEATAHLKAYLEPKGLYHYDGRPLLKAMWQTAHNCHFVDGVEGVQYFKSFEKKTKSSLKAA